MLNKITNYLILVFLFLLPWQTRWIYGTATLNGRAWEYGTLSFYGIEILLWLIIIFTGIRLFVNKEFWQNISKKSTWHWRLFVFALGLSLMAFGLYAYAVSPAKEVSVQFMSRFIGAICLMICLIQSELGFKKMSLAFWGGGVLQGLLAIWQFFSQNVFSSKWLGVASHSASDIGAAVIQTADERWLRAYGSFGWPNSLGIYLAVVFVLGILLTQKFSKKLQPLFLAGQIIIATGLIFSFSRGAWLAGALGIIFLMILAIWKKQKQTILLILKNIIAGILILIVLLAILPNLFTNRFQATGYLEQLSLGERSAQFGIAQTIIFDNFFKGVGPGLFTYYLADNFEAPAYGLYQPVHNIYLLAMAELGIILFTVVIIGLLFLIKRLYKTNLIFLPVIFILLCFGFFDHYLWTLFGGQILLFSIFGLVLAKNDL
jgi:hypothetical protein